FWKCEAGVGWFDMRDIGAVLEPEEPLPHRSEDQEHFDVASSKSRDLDDCPRSLTQGGNHELNRSSGASKFSDCRNVTLVRSKEHHDTKIVSSGDGRSFYVPVPCLGKFSIKYESATFYKSAYYKSASLGRFSR